MWRSLVAHVVRDDGVAGSNPVIPTIKVAGTSWFPRLSGRALPVLRNLSWLSTDSHFESDCYEKQEANSMDPAAEVRAVTVDAPGSVGREEADPAP